MNTIKSFITKFPVATRFVVPGAVMFAFIQLPFKVNFSASEIALPLATAQVEAGGIQSVLNAPLADVFFGKDENPRVASSIIESKAEFVKTRKAYPAALAVIQKHENTIREKARKKNVPEDVALGVGLLENGGSETAKSPAGALGVFQLMPGTARNLGLVVNSKVDERRIPEKNIEAGVTYLRKNYERFGDWGLSTWAYHAGEGNVAKALKIYAKANHGINLPGIKDTATLRNYVERYDITIHKLLSDPAVLSYVNKLNDDSKGYPYKVVATAKLFGESKK